MRLRCALAAVFFLVAAAVSAQKPKKTERPLDVLENEMDRLGKPGKGLGRAGESKQDASASAEEVKRLKSELAGKAEAIRQLEDENEKLRQALRLRFGGGALPPVPIPNRELLESVLKEPAPFAERKEKTGPPSAPEEYTVVSEWGRSPEVAASLPGKVASLIGLALAVPRGMKEAEVKQLGQDLRKNYQAYDNINIEAFDEVEAARRFANEGKTDGGHRVLSISKFKHSGRDIFVIFHGDQAVNVP